MKAYDQFLFGCPKIGILICYMLFREREFSKSFYDMFSANTWHRDDCVSVFVFTMGTLRNHDGNANQNVT